MPTKIPAYREPDSGPAGVRDRIIPTDGGTSPFYTTPPPRYTNHKSKRVVTVDECIQSPAYVDERRPLLYQPHSEPEPEPNHVSSWCILLVLVSMFLLFYSMMPSADGNCRSLLSISKVQVQHLTERNLALGKDVSLYKSMYEDVRVQAGHLDQENAALEDEMHDLQIKLHDLREHLANAKVSAFWEIARTMNTNMYVPRSLPLSPLIACFRDIWVGADDPGGGPKFWSYGITSGLYNDNDPPVTSIKLHFADWQAATVENTENRRIVGYKVESNRYNNGWWIASGLDEFGQGGSHEVRFSAKQANGGAEYEVTVFYAEWKL